MSLTVFVLLAVAAGVGWATWALVTGYLHASMEFPRRYQEAGIATADAPATHVTHTDVSSGAGR